MNENYYFYGDIYIILNFILNLFLASINTMILQKKCSFLRMIIVSFIFAVLSLANTYMLWNYKDMSLLIAGINFVGFTCFIFPFEGIIVLLKEIGIMFLLACFTGGTIIAVYQLLFQILKKEKGYSFWMIFIAIIILFILFFLYRFEIIRQRQKRKNICMARVIHGGIECEIRVLYDTGNQLISPYTGESVAIISEELCERLFLKRNQNPILIPYYSIGGSGVLKAFRIEKMQLEDNYQKKNFLAAVSNRLCENNEIQMILNIT